jgi:hypothetical protein
MSLVVFGLLVCGSNAEEFIATDENQMDTDKCGEISPQRAGSSQRQEKNTIQFFRRIPLRFLRTSLESLSYLCPSAFISVAILFLLRVAPPNPASSNPAYARTAGRYTSASVAVS